MGLYDTAAGDRLRGRIEALFGFASEDDRNLLDVLICGLGVGTPLAMKANFVGTATAANSAVAETALSPVFDMKFLPGSTARQARLLAWKAMQGAGLTAHDTNYATISLYSYTSAGASKTTVASNTTKITGGTGNWTAFAQVDLGGLVASVSALPAGGGLSYDVSKQGSGVAISADAILAVYGYPL